VQHYNVMGPAKASLEALVRGLALEVGPVRVNAVSAGPVSTMAARGIRNFDTIKEDVKARSMLGRNITAEEVAETVAFLASNASSGISGQTIYVDGGYSVVAGPRLI
jgi:enoyl-[acyl-carrier protein] reductase I